MTRLKILHAVHGFPPEFEGGTELYVLELCRALQDLGHEALVLAGSGRTSRRERIERGQCAGVRVLRLHRSGRFHEGWRRTHAPRVEEALREVLAEERPSLVHVHHWKRLCRNIACLARRSGIPSVITLHDLWSTCAKEFRLRDGRLCDERLLDVDCEGCVDTRPWLEAAEVRADLGYFRRDLRLELDTARALLAPSRAHRDRVAALHGIEPERIRVLPLGAIRNLEPTRTRRPDRFPIGPLRIGHWSHLDACKGTHVLLEAARLLERRGGFEVHLFGGSVTRGYEMRIRGLAQGLPVTFHGPYGPSDLAAAGLDLAVVPSVTAESYSYVVDEALQLGVPLLVSNLGALPERIGGGGAAFPPGDAAALAALLGGVLEDPETLAEYRAALPAAGPGMEQHAARIASVYREALEKGDAGSEAAWETRERDLLRFRLDQLEEREVSLLELEAQAGSWKARAFRLESDLARIRREGAELRAELRRRVEELAASRAPGGTPAPGQGAGAARGPGSLVRRILRALRPGGGEPGR